MFVGHYGVSFAAKRLAPQVPLWVLFVAVQLLDVFWAPLVLLGVERVRIVPGITASNPLDLYYMLYTHSLVAAALWALVALLAWRWRSWASGRRANGVWAAGSSWPPRCSRIGCSIWSFTGRTCPSTTIRPK